MREVSGPHLPSAVSGLDIWILTPAVRHGRFVRKPAGLPLQESRRIPTSSDSIMQWCHSGFQFHGNKYAMQRFSDFWGSSRLMGPTGADTCFSCYEQSPISNCGCGVHRNLRHGPTGGGLLCTDVSRGFAYAVFLAFGAVAR